MTFEGSGRWVDVTSFASGLHAGEGTFFFTGGIVGVLGSGLDNKVADVGGSLEANFGRGGDQVVSGFCTGKNAVTTAEDAIQFVKAGVVGGCQGYARRGRFDGSSVGLIGNGSVDLVVDKFVRVPAGAEGV